MRRIFSDHAYDYARIENCYWAETVPDSTLMRPALIGAEKADVAIIGAGFTGLSAALRLAESGVKTVVLDATFPGFGASGRNGGFCCLGGAKASNGMIDRMHGKPARLEYRQAEVAAVKHVAETLSTHEIDAETHSKGETIVSHKAGYPFEAEAREIEENYGVTPTLHSKSELETLGMPGPFHGGMTTPIGFGLNPRKYLVGLLRAAEAAGVTVYGASPVSDISRSGTYALKTPQGTLEAEQLTLATNGYSSEDVPPWLAARYMPSQSSVIVTRELTDAELAAGWHSDQMSYDSRNLLHYFRLMPNRRFLFGMRGGLTSSDLSEAAIKRKIRSDFESMFPAWAQVETPHYWSGMVCLSAGLTPFAGPVPDMPGTYAGFAYHGNGVAMGSYTGALLAEQILGSQKLLSPKLMQKPPLKFPLGRARRALMLGIYAGAALKDW
ncbi:FAD-binding oxidoreductase [Lentibacter algarum]|uniref:NAD(P)/FAD-dependent oxidoreductase n=1 Tax=Lentibacter algarum TaxID=576131 RepID=UPI001C0667D8|nr:FAD-binding oxidoreductase [Lentibacter algarum]MBU2980424.1 FAD-binding oxidoreductase [Lentibacter algarum]